MMFEFDGHVFQNVARWTPEDAKANPTASVVAVRCWAGSPNLYTLWLVAHGVDVQVLEMMYSILGWVFASGAIHVLKEGA